MSEIAEKIAGALHFQHYGLPDCLARDIATVDRILSEQWISVKERLPESQTDRETSEYVIVTLKRGMNCLIAFYDFRRRKWDDGDYLDDIDGITHWQPLPQPPKDTP